MAGSGTGDDGGGGAGLGRQQRGPPRPPGPPGLAEPRDGGGQLQSGRVQARASNEGPYQAVIRHYSNQPAIPL